MPTSQEYLNLFSNYLSQVSVKQKKTHADLGTGSGVLPIVMKENGGFKGKSHCFDTVENAVECAKMNMELYGMNEQNFHNVDLVDLWHPPSGTPDAFKKPKNLSFYQNLASQISMP